MSDNWVEVEVFVLVDENGDYVASHDGEQLGALYDEAIGGMAEMPRRIVRVKIKVEKPAEIELIGEAPLTGNGAKLLMVEGGAA